MPLRSRPSSVKEFCGQGVMWLISSLQQCCDLSVGIKSGLGLFVGDGGQGLGRCSVGVGLRMGIGRHLVGVGGRVFSFGWDGGCVWVGLGYRVGLVLVLSFWCLGWVGVEVLCSTGSVVYCCGGLGPPSSIAPPSLCSLSPSDALVQVRRFVL